MKAVSAPDAAPPLSTSLLALLAEAKESMHAAMRVRVVEAGFPELRPPHGFVFRYLTEDGARLSDMAERAGMTKQALAEHVGYLEDHGYVVREPDPDDGRAKLVVPTARGLEAMRVAGAAFDEVERAWGDRVGHDRVLAMRQTLTAILER